MSRFSRRFVGSCLIAATLGMPAARGESVSIAASRDNMLVESATGALSNGAGSHFHVGHTGQFTDGVRRGLIHFDVAAAIPAGATVTSAVLRLNVSKANAITARTINLRRVTNDWGEGTSAAIQGEGQGAAATAGDATWKHTFFDTDFWTVAGGDAAGTISAGTSVTGLGTYTWSAAQMLADVRSWLDAPAGNFGWMLQSDDETSVAKVFDSRTHATPASRPSLTVGFVPPAPTAPDLPALERPRLTALLDGDQEVPPQANAFSGAALFTYDRTARLLRYAIQHGVTNATFAHIHGPAGVGTNAPPVFDLGDPASPIVGSNVLSQAQEDALFDGLYYVNVHSAEFPGGAVRGQIVDTTSFGALLSGEDEVPPVVSAASGVAVLTYDPLTSQLVYVVEHNVVNPSGAHVHGPALPGFNAGILVNLGDPANPIQGAATVSPAVAAALRKGFAYINVHSGVNPGGEIRGQVLRVREVPPITHTAELDGAQEVPPQPEAACGVALLAYDRATRTLRYRIEHGVTNATLIHIHGPAGVGTNAGIVVNLGDPASPVDGSTMLSAGQEQDFLSGLYYINIHSATYPAGAIRGQILQRSDLTATLQGRQEAPPLATRDSGLGVFTFDRPTRRLTYKIVHDVPNATAAHIHGPADFGVAAGVLVNFGDPASPMTGTVELADAFVPSLLAGRLYVNVHSTAHPGGEIRGQILASERVPRITHTARLDGGQEAPPVATPATGLAVLAYDPLTRVLTYDVQHTVSNVTAAHIHGPAGIGTNAPVVFGFPSGASPIRGCVPLTPPQELHLLGGLYYINVHSVAHGGGEIRGQILPFRRFAAVLQGRQETARPATAALGLGVFEYDPATHTLDYRIAHSVPNVSAAHIHGPAAPGVSAGIVHGFASPASPITGSVAFTEAQSVELLRGRYYVNVHSPRFPPGEVRGQILETWPDTDVNGIPDHWERRFGLAPGGYDADDDADDDGRTTREEFVSDTDPTNVLSVIRIDEIAVASPASIQFETSPLRDYGLQAADDLPAGDWTDLGPRLAGTGGVMTVVDTNAPSPRFYRLNVFLPD